MYQLSSLHWWSNQSIFISLYRLWQSKLSHGASQGLMHNNISSIQPGRCRGFNYPSWSWETFDQTEHFRLTLIIIILSSWPKDTFLPEVTTEALVHTFISCLDYFDTLTISNPQLCQNSAGCLLNKYQDWANITPVLKWLHEAPCTVPAWFEGSLFGFLMS